MKKITTAELNSEKNASFVAYFTRVMKPWENNGSLTDEQRATEVPAILLLNRWDGRVGFAGGNVDAGETLLQSAARESLEEINNVVSEDELTAICSHNFQAGKQTLSTHLFAKEVSVDELMSIQQNVHTSRDFGDEITGTVLCLVGDFGRGKGFPNFLKSPMATSVKEELIELISTQELVSNSSLEEMCNTAGLSSSELLFR